ncbi:MAG: ribonuclease J [Methylotetracoccus sp.]
MTPTADELLFLPLGGTGEIGMNLSLYGHDGAWLAVDIGITFGGDEFPQYDVMMADPDFIARRRERLVAIVLTHAHEDHVGALPYLWRRLQCPVYATPFTAALARAKLVRAGIDETPVVEIPLGERFDAGPFTIEYIGMTHSIPEPNALLIGTRCGAVLHTGDWKLDDQPVIGRHYDRRRLVSLRREPLLAMVCDSTNAVVPGHTGSESSLYEPLREIAEQAQGRVLVTSFASNVARLATLARVAAAVGRRFGVIGPAMERMLALARATGYWPAGLPDIVDPRHLGFLPPGEVLAACTGSQGEDNSALARIATDRHPHLLLDARDTVVFSSRMIPGNERSVERLQTRLKQIGAEVVTDHDAHVHVSGHPAEDDLKRLYDWVRPPVVIPVHGTPRHLAANAAIAEACHVPVSRVIANGDICRLGPHGPELVDRTPTGRLKLDGDGGLSSVPAETLAVMLAKGR